MGDHIDKICDAQKLYDDYEYVETTGGGSASWELAKTTEASNRTANEQKWQTHSLKELCDNIIKATDDEIKDSFMKIRRKKLKGLEFRNEIVQDACKRARLCTAKTKRTEL